MSILQAAGRIGGVTLLSRVLGLYRDVLMLRMFGWSWALGTFAFAWMVPNLLRRLLGEGALSASFIPAYARARQQQGEAGARRLLAAVLGPLLLVLGLLAALVVGACLLLPAESIGQAGEDVDALTQGQLMLRLVGILFPYAVPICLAAILAGVLNSHGVFALPAAAPVVLNLFWIAGIWVGSAWGMEDPAEALSLIAVFLLVGGCAQLSLSLVPLLRRRLLPLPRLQQEDNPAQEVLLGMGPTVLGMSLVQVNTVMDQALALYLVGPVAPSFIYYANRLLLFPHALTSLALATALFPSLADAAAAGRHGDLRRLLDRACRHTTLIALPAALGLILIAEPLLALMAGEQLSDDADLWQASITTMLLCASLPFIGIAQLQARALFALGDYRGPAWMSGWLLLTNLALNLLFVLVFDMGVAGLALATSLASVANTLGLRRRLNQRLDPGPRQPRQLLQALAAAGCMALCVLAVQQLPAGDSATTRILTELALPVAAGVVSYGGLMYLFGMRGFRMRP